MPRTLMVWTNPTLKVAVDEASLATGAAVECQVTSAVLTPSASFTTIPATGCAPAAQSPGQTGYNLDLAWLQDWSDAAGLSRFAWDNDAQQVWVELTPNKADATGSVLTGPFFCTAGGYGGTFGDGSAAAATASWPAVEKPDISAPTTPLVAADEPAAV